MSDYSDFSIHKWDDYGAPEPKTPRQEWLHKTHNDIYRARSLLRQSLEVLPLEVLKNEDLLKTYGALEVALTEQYNKWKNME